MVRADQIPPGVPAAAGRPDSGHERQRPLHGPRLLTPKGLTPDAIDALIRQRGAKLGFDVIGYAGADCIPEVHARLKGWLEDGHHGEMLWMAEEPDKRASPPGLWREVKSVILFGVNYGMDGDPLAPLAEPEHGTIALYARRKDYHDTMKGRLKELAGFLKAKAGGEVKVFVDTAPVMEKPLGAAAGLGWLGKNTLLISRQFGTWLFLGAIYTTLDLTPAEAQRDLCGSCTRCLDACPTDAFPAPYVLDSRRCISYLTIEHPGVIPAEFRQAIGNRIYGCDDCLAVCPWNKFASASRDAKLVLRPDLMAPDLASLARLSDAGFRTLFSATPIKRTGRDRFVRNVLVAIGNSGNPALAGVARDRLGDASALVRGMAVWALSQLMPREDFAPLAATQIKRETDADVIAEWRAALEGPCV